MWDPHSSLFHEFLSTLYYNIQFGDIQNLDNTPTRESLFILVIFIILAIIFSIGISSFVQRQFEFPTLQDNAHFMPSDRFYQFVVKCAYGIFIWFIIPISLLGVGSSLLIILATSSATWELKFGAARPVYFNVLWSLLRVIFFIVAFAISSKKLGLRDIGNQSEKKKKNCPKQRISSPVILCLSYNNTAKFSNP